MKRGDPFFLVVPPSSPLIGEPNVIVSRPLPNGRGPFTGCLQCPHFDGVTCNCVHPETLDHPRWWMRAYHRFLEWLA